MKNFIVQAISSLTVFSALQISTIVSATPLDATNQGPKVKIANGTVYGVHNDVWNQDYFLSIPYAQAPVGNLRFRPAQHIRVKRDFQAKEYGPFCYAYGGETIGYNVSEDCLTLNIIRPADISPRSYGKLPVAVWIHGGGFVGGSANNRRYNLTFMVDQSVKMGTPIIGMAINYRVAGWGFLSGRQVAGTKNLNLGLRDQRVALHWIQENIAAFGGDPEKVTIFGESAGAFSVGFQQIAYNGRDDGLFRGAIMQSGSPVMYRPFPFPDTNQKNYDAVIEATGCAEASDSLQCLRAVDVELLNKALNTTSGMEFQPVIDGEFITSLGSQALLSGRYVKVPTIVGSTSDEGASFSQFGFDDEQQIKNWLTTTTKFTNKTIDRLLELYDKTVSIPPAENFTHPNDGTKKYGKEYHRVAALNGDLMFIAGRRHVAEVLSAQDVPVWSYRFRTAPNGFSPWLRSPHYSEVAFVFYNLYAEGYKSPVTWDGESQDPLGGPNAAEYRKLADYMSKSWIRFFVNGDPSVGRGVNKDDVKWLKYKDGNGKSQIVFDIAPHSTYMETDDYRKEGMGYIIKNFLQNGI
ncbi:hypothetical protein H072_45 [Dactylellina haptotyla CBS 200.50]|uniref:Carboxylic ester hydrolase n=1 Tax=Dactylellina haptotyla (strain CBS 200.50) TaxID=1284197 RepID=S8CE96_DACHA|nr:hypothetical protein H072_45 [Dactylellina haptotyla CBS 200.50]